MTEPFGSSALRLLQTILEVAPGGRVFTSRDAIVAAAELGIGPEHTYKMLSILVRRGFLERPRDGLYVPYLPAFDDALDAFQTMIGRVFGTEPVRRRLD